MKKSRIIILSIFIFLAVVILTVAVYLGTYYKADDSVQQCIATAGGIVDTSNEHYVAIVPDSVDTDTALIFYPGGRVDHYAYIPLCVQIAIAANIAVYIPRVPFNLAVFDYDVAQSIIQGLNTYTHLYVGGHSLGGAMASQYYAEHLDRLSGLILVASYPVADTVNSISIYGSNDLILDKDKANNAGQVYIIEGGNHANFGNYGPQKGDGVATISRADQCHYTAIRISEFIKDTIA